MDHANLADLQRMSGRPNDDRIRLLRSFDLRAAEDEVPEDDDDEVKAKAKELFEEGNVLALFWCIISCSEEDRLSKTAWRIENSSSCIEKASSSLVNASHSVGRASSSIGRASRSVGEGSF